MFARRIDDYWTIEGHRDLSDSWTRIHTIRRIGRKKNLQMGFHGPGGGWRRNKRHPGLITCGQRHGRTCQKQRNEKKNKSGQSKNRSLTMPEDWAVFTSLIQQMRSSRKLFKNARRKLEVPMPAAMPCKIRRRKYKETCRTPDTRKTKYACIVEADESTRKRLEGTLHKDHEDHIAGKGINSLNHYNLVHKLIPMPKAMKIPDAKAAVDKEWENSRKYRHGSWRMSETKKRWSMKQGKKAKPCTWRH